MNVEYMEEIMSATNRIYFSPNQFRGFDSGENHEVYSILIKMNRYFEAHPHTRWNECIDALSFYEYKVLEKLMIIDGFGNIDINKINEETLFGMNNVSITDSFSFWAWRKIVAWKDTEEKTSLKVLKHIAAEGAFLGIGALGCVETFGRLLTKPIRVTIDYIRDIALDERPNTTIRLSAIATAGALTGLVTNFLPRELETDTCTVIAKVVTKATTRKTYI